MINPPAKTKRFNESGMSIVSKSMKVIAISEESIKQEPIILKISSKTKEFKRYPKAFAISTNGYLMGILHLQYLHFPFNKM